MSTSVSPWKFCGTGVPRWRPMRPVGEGGVVVRHSVDREAAHQDEAAPASQRLPPRLDGGRERLQLHVGDADLVARNAAQGRDDVQKIVDLRARGPIHPLVATREIVASTMRRVPAGGVRARRLRRQPRRRPSWRRSPSSMLVDTVAHRIDACQYPFMSMKAKLPRCCSPVLQAPLGRNDAADPGWGLQGHRGPRSSSPAELPRQAAERRGLCLLSRRAAGIGAADREPPPEGVDGRGPRHARASGDVDVLPTCARASGGATRGAIAAVRKAEGPAVGVTHGAHRDGHGA